MTTVANIAVALVALLHLNFLVLEMFYWDKPLGRRIFGLKPEFAKASKNLAANRILQVCRRTKADQPFDMQPKRHPNLQAEPRLLRDPE